LCRLAAEAAGLFVARQDRDGRVTREAEHRHLALAGRDVREHYRVRALAVNALGAADSAVPAGTVVRAGDQGGQRVRIVGWALARLYHADLPEAVPEGAVLRVPVERAAHQDHGGADRCPSGEHHAARVAPRGPFLAFLARACGARGAPAEAHI